MTRGADDLYATVPEPVFPGQEGVHLVLDTGAAKTMAPPPGVKAPGAPASARPASRSARTSANA